MCYDKGGLMYTFKDKVIDAVTAVIGVAGFIVLYIAASLADLAIVGM